MSEKRHYVLDAERFIVLRGLIDPSSGLMRGTCPECKGDTLGRNGATIIEYTMAREYVPNGGYTTSWGHYECMERRFDQIIESVEGWITGQQKDWIDFVHAHNGLGIVETDFAKTRNGKKGRYRYRLSKHMYRTDNHG